MTLILKFRVVKLCLLAFFFLKANLSRELSLQPNAAASSSAYIAPSPLAVSYFLKFNLNPIHVTTSNTIRCYSKLENDSIIYNQQMRYI